MVWGNDIFQKHGVCVVLFSSVLCDSTQVGQAFPRTITSQALKLFKWLVKATSFLFAMQMSRQHGAFNCR